MTVSRPRQARTVGYHTFDSHKTSNRGYHKFNSHNCSCLMPCMTWSCKDVPLESFTLRCWGLDNYEYFMMDWTRLVSKLLKLMPKKLPRECMLQGYMFASSNDGCRTQVHTCHILPPSEIDLGLFLLFLQAQEGNNFFTELAERVEYGNYEVGVQRLPHTQL